MLNRLFIIWALPLTILVSSSEILDFQLLPRYIFLALGLILFGILSWNERRKNIQSAWLLPDLLLLLYYAWNLFSISHAHLKMESLFETQKILLLLGIYRLVRTLLDTDAERAEKWLFGACAATTLIVMGVTASQLFGLSEGDPFGYLANEANTYKLTGLSAHRNLNAGFLLCLLPFNLLAAFRFSSLLRYLMGLLVGLQFFMLYLLHSDAVTLGFGLFAATLVLGWAVLAFVRWRREKGAFPVLPAAVLGLILTGLAATVATGKMDAFMTKLRESDTGRERLFLWYRTEQLLKDNWLLGVGNGNWQIMFPSKSIQGGWRLQEQEVYATRPHNDFLWIWAETGIIGLIMWMLLLGLVAAAALRVSLRSSSLAKGFENWIIAGGLFAYMLFSFWDFPRERLEFQPVLGIMLAWLVFAGRPVWDKVFSIKKMPKPVYLGAALLLAVSIFIGYKRYIGEKYMVGAQRAKSAQQWAEVKAYATLAKSDYYLIDPMTFPIAWYQGMGDYFTNNKAESYKEFEEAYRVHPYNTHVLNNYGTSLLQQERFQDARELYEKAYFINPEFEEGKRNLVVACANLKDFNAAREWLKKAVVDSTTYNRFEQYIQQKEAGK